MPKNKRPNKNSTHQRPTSNEPKKPPREYFKELREGKAVPSGTKQTQQQQQPSSQQQPPKQRTFKQPVIKQASSRPSAPKSSGPWKKNNPEKKHRSYKPSPVRTENLSSIKPMYARVEKNRKGFAFLVFENKEFEDMYVDADNAAGFFQGDRVEVLADSRGHIQSLRVIYHRFKELVGKFRAPKTLVYERKNSFVEILMPKGAPENTRTGDYIRGKLTFHDSGPNLVTAECVEVFGSEIPASRDVEWIASEHSLEEHHSEAAKNEAKALTLDLKKDLEGREDQREIPFVTIDGKTARDFDDAVFVERTANGFKLWVAIADVSHYVKPGTQIDKEAYDRATSVYFPERAFHMLPRELSENLCSLRPDEPRLTMTATIEIDKNGNTKNIQISNSIIESKKRIIYEDLQAEYEENKENAEWNFHPHFELYRVLKKSRQKRGSIDFELPEAQILVDENGEPTEVVHRARMDAHKLIEEFMIRANEAVTEWMLKIHHPFVYRVHGLPSVEALARFGSIAQTLGINVNSKLWEDGEIESQKIAEMVRTIEDHPASEFLNHALLRSMKQAVYSSEHDIHFGLASEAYTHFTSPIRRYPDLLVHRLLKMALKKEKYDPKVLVRKLAEQCDHSSYRERLAAEAERESIKLKQVRIARTCLGKVYKGKLTGMTQNGFFIGLNDPYFEGFVSKDSIQSEFFEFNEQRMIYYGQKTKTTLKIGDQIDVLVVRADIEKRQVDFEWQRSKEK